ncbi:MAG TPA: hypothetical protein VGM93_02910 [Acidimicrobiales bacterium]
MPRGNLTRWTGVAVITLALGVVVACSSGKDSSSSTTTKPATTVAATATAGGPTGESTSTPTTPTTPTTAGDSSSGGSVTACAAVTAADIRAAGVTGTVKAGVDQTANFSLDADGRDGSACSYDVVQKSVTTNLIVIIEPKGGHDLFATASDDAIGAQAAPIPGLGDEANYVLDPANGGTPGRGSVVARHGDALVEASITESTFATQASLTTIVRTLLTKVG